MHAWWTAADIQPEDHPRTLQYLLSCCSAVGPRGREGVPSVSSMRPRQMPMFGPPCRCQTHNSCVQHRQKYPKALIQPMWITPAVRSCRLCSLASCTHSHTLVVYCGSCTAQLIIDVAPAQLIIGSLLLMLPMPSIAVVPASTVRPSQDIHKIPVLPSILNPKPQNPSSLCSRQWRCACQNNEISPVLTAQC